MNNEEKKTKEDTAKEQKVCLHCGEPANITHCGVFDIVICDKCKIEMGEMVHNSIKQGTVLNVIKPRTKEDNVEEQKTEEDDDEKLTVSDRIKILSEINCMDAVIYAGCYNEFFGHTIADFAFVVSNGYATKTTVRNRVWDIKYILEKFKETHEGWGSDGKQCMFVRAIEDRTRHILKYLEHSESSFDSLLEHFNIDMDNPESNYYGELNPCPFCNRKNLLMEYYDFGRGYTDTIYPETERIAIECDCGCSLEVNVGDILDVEDKESYAIGKWNGRM